MVKTSEAGLIFKCNPFQWVRKKMLTALDADKNKITFDQDDFLWNTDVVVIIFFYVNNNKLISGNLEINNWDSFVELCFNNPDIIFLIETDKNDVGFEEFSNQGR